MTRPAPRDRIGLPCARSQRFLTRSSAAAFAAHNNKSHTVVECACGGWHTRRATPEEIAARESRREAERKARVAAHLATVPARGDER